MDTDLALDLLLPPKAEAAITPLPTPTPEDQPDVFVYRMEPTAMNIPGYVFCLDGFVHPGADSAPIMGGMAQMATEFAYAVSHQMDLCEEGNRCLGQLDNLEEFHNPFVMTVTISSLKLMWHLTQLPNMAHWPKHWYECLCIDMGTMDCLIPIAVIKNCCRPPLPAAYILHHMGGWTEPTFHDALVKIPKLQITDFTCSIIKLLPWWSLHPERDGSFVLPWWLDSISNYANKSWVLHSDEVQTIAQRYFRNLWPLPKSPTKDCLHGVLEAWVEWYKNNALRVEVLLPGLMAKVEELFEQLTCMAQMLGWYHEPNTCILCGTCPQICHNIQHM
ncbi:hypothetical protein F5J12DRAFT_785314 [Pisolithus orientalis]|uniref:uncharacterized protein n=1 Tax=Pisolithus orientalis TaxID=936130 RepID=UPI002224C326|nr:uncharacterized protein F5J12DRAFT_785314 [Pisolithus orientalis]KAI5996902.1 hypothetical protein F5J12DRAFT_785314 [Pisolithus orientalis]